MDFSLLTCATPTNPTHARTGTGRDARTLARTAFACLSLSPSDSREALCPAPCEMALSRSQTALVSCGLASRSGLDKFEKFSQVFYAGSLLAAAPWWLS